ncbi:uncharacterized protein LOC129003719 [Macrosteles quadrilineatus]|uniref:uncharacterized protein LOC129003719 n=1 Tax=Macrosteles quadrilineatus TaxID=74068 RepID=UPI0023E0F8FA|nr:uncharacterized protein LOC129003719 [Macrosteles quadrilineatus]
MGDKNTTMGLFFSLKPSLMMVKTSPLAEVPEVEVEEEVEPPPSSARLRSRRRSSMSDLDTLRSPRTMPDRKLGLAGSGALTGSFGDLMNLKKYSGHGVQSSSMESVIARTLPLSTVTSPGPVPVPRTRKLPLTPPGPPPNARRPLTCSQRAERFSRLLDKQKTIPSVCLVRVRTLVSTCFQLRLFSDWTTMVETPVVLLWWPVKCAWVTSSAKSAATQLKV